MHSTTLVRRSTRALALAVFFALPMAARADVKLPALFSEHMVLQQDVAAPVWGTATAGEKVTVKIGDQTATATAGADGKWMTKVGPLKAGGPLEMTIAGNNSITIKDVLVGEVWVCSGQSNMGMTVAGVKDNTKEIAEADHPQIRMFHVANTAVDEPASDVKGSWSVCTPKNVPGFSAAAYFFGRDLHEAIKRPVGLINTSWGGTAIQPWISAEGHLSEPMTKEPYEAFQKLPMVSKEDADAYAKAQNEWRTASAAAKKEGKPAPAQPKRPAGRFPGEPAVARLYNGMVAPLIPYAIRGATWYQGESNGGQGMQYRTWMPLLITDWRKHWNQEGANHDFPFLIVQLPNNGKERTNNADGNGWPLVREAEMLTASKLPNVGTAVTIDTSSDGDLHPKEKQPVGHRLALIAENKVYGMTEVVASGPVLDSAKPEGDKLRLTFKETHGGLEAKGGDKLVGFFVAGEDKKFHPADATIEGDAVVLHSADVTNPVAARYAWSQNPECNLYNKAGLPTGPFRTDTWDAAPAPVKRAAK